ncbi:16509_t:CDS:1, partial [Racocetra fulgida]
MSNLENFNTLPEEDLEGLVDVEMEDLDDIDNMEEIDEMEDIEEIKDAEVFTDIDDIENLVNIGIENKITNISEIPIEIISTAGNSNKDRSSPVWQYIYEKKNNDNKVIARVCAICEQNYSPTTSTRILNRHLKNKHNIILTLKNSLYSTKIPYGKEDIECKKECFNAIFNLIIGAQLPFSFIEHPLVREMAK